jgi:AmmeMemoRadiSam system protein B
MGEVSIDAHLADALITACPLLQADTEAHAYEHSLEVELPHIAVFQAFLQDGAHRHNVA